MALAIWYQKEIQKKIKRYGYASVIAKFFYESYMDNVWFAEGLKNTTPYDWDRGRGGGDVLFGRMPGCYGFGKHR